MSSTEQRESCASAATVFPDNAPCCCCCSQRTLPGLAFARHFVIATRKVIVQVYIIHFESCLFSIHCSFMSSWQAVCLSTRPCPAPVLSSALCLFHQGKDRALSPRAACCLQSKTPPSLFYISVCPSLQEAIYSRHSPGRGPVTAG